GVVVAVAALAAGVAGPVAYAIDTATTPHTGAIPSAGPSGQGNGFGPRGFARFGGPPPGGAFGGRPFGGGPFGGGAVLGPPGGLGGLLDTATPSSELVTALKQDASSYTWVAAAVGSNSAAGVQLATGKPVMAIGGFNGSDPTPTLAQFQAFVRAGKVHYFLASGGRGGGPGGGPGVSSTSQAITSWVQSTFTSTTIGGVTVYDLTANVQPQQ
ncbi:MAG: hypothetical protein QOG34_1119, partial [Frankiaceae bacterium]|nr:hypothetical protein [Frankiaceae bacterium]